MKVLLTGGSGFIAAHILKQLLERGHTIVTTVRSHSKATRIQSQHPTASPTQLTFSIVPEISHPSAFDAAVQSTPPFDAVVHTASPLNHSLSNIQRDVLNPAVLGTTSLLSSVARFAPSVQRVVLLSSFAAIIDVSQGNRPSYTYTASDWNPITHAEALTNSLSAYRGSKTFAERAAWDFMEREKPRFALTTLNPPFVFGPVVPYAGLSLEDVNASNRFFVDFLKGKATETIYYAWIHVEDCAAAHVKAIEAGAAERGNERVFLTSAEQFCHRGILEIMHEEFPELRARLPDRQDWDGLGYPEGGVYKVDATRARELIGKEFITLRRCVVETVDMIRKVL